MANQMAAQTVTAPQASAAANVVLQVNNLEAGTASRTSCTA